MAKYLETLISRESKGLNLHLNHSHLLCFSSDHSGMNLEINCRNKLKNKKLTWRIKKKKKLLKKKKKENEESVMKIKTKLKSTLIQMIVKIYEI